MESEEGRSSKSNQFGVRSFSAGSRRLTTGLCVSHKKRGAKPPLDTASRRYHACITIEVHRDLPLCDAPPLLSPQHYSTCAHPSPSPTAFSSSMIINHHRPSTTLSSIGLSLVHCPIMTAYPIATQPTSQVPPCQLCIPSVSLVTIVHWCSMVVSFDAFDQVHIAIRGRHQSPPPLDTFHE